MFDETSIRSDFTAVAVISGPDRLRYLRIGLTVLGSTIESGLEEAPNHWSTAAVDVPGPPVLVRDRSYSFTWSQLNVVLAASDERLDPWEFNTISSAFYNAGSAHEMTAGQGYAHYKIQVASPLGVLRIIDQLLIVNVSVPDVIADSNVSSSSAELVAALLADVQSKLPRSVRPIRISTRRYLVEAVDTVRVADPYSDDTERVLNDLMAFPRRGVDLRMVTHEADIDNPNQSAVSTTENITGQLSGDERKHFSVQDFYDTNRRDKQIGATHAKAVITDKQVAYLSSADFTRLSLTGNFELGVLLRGEAVPDLVAVFDAMFDCSRPIPI